MTRDHKCGAIYSIYLQLQEFPEKERFSISSSLRAAPFISMCMGKHTSALGKYALTMPRYTLMYSLSRVVLTMTGFACIALTTLISRLARIIDAGRSRCWTKRRRFRFFKQALQSINKARPLRLAKVGLFASGNCFEAFQAGRFPAKTSFPQEPRAAVFKK